MSQFDGLFKVLKKDKPQMTDTKQQEKVKAPRVQKAKEQSQTKTAKNIKSSASIADASETRQVEIKSIDASALAQEQAPALISQPKPTTAQGKQGRGGKSSNPNYQQVLSYVRRDTYKAVRRQLLDESNSDFSELVETLLSNWLKSC